MARYAYGSDLHFHHSYVAKLRGFTKIIEGPSGEPVIAGDTEAHDEMILQNWNETIRKDDIAIIPGDFALNWKGVSEKLARMKGRKILITGNHDIMWGGSSAGWKYVSRWTGEDRFESILPYMTRKAGKREFLVSHFPYTGDHEGLEDRCTQYRLRDEGRWLVHGHTHRNVMHDFAVHPRQLHVGMDACGMHPVLEGDLLDLMKALDDQAAGE